MLSFPKLPYSRKAENTIDNENKTSNKTERPEKKPSVHPEEKPKKKKASGEGVKSEKNAEEKRDTAAKRYTEALRGDAAAEEVPAKKKKRKKKKKSYTGLLITILLVFVLLLVGTASVYIMALKVDKLMTVFPGVSINGMRADGMTEKQVLERLTAREEAAYDGFSVTVTLPMEHSLTVTAEDAELKFQCEEAASMAFRVGRTGNLLENLYTWVRHYYLNEITTLYSESAVTFSEEHLRELVEQKTEEINEKLLASEYRVGQYSINVVKGANAFHIDADLVSDYLIDAILHADPTPIVYEVDMRTDEELDLDSLYEELTVEAVSAEYDPELGGATQSQVGVTFDLAGAKKLWAAAEYGETVAIPLIITEPETSAEEINNMLFRDLLGEKTTSLAGSTTNRVNNVKKACELLSQIVLQPGEQFSYNDCLGERTGENGWYTAAAYSDGEVVEEYGGGICQVSSTLFVSTLLSDLKIDSRSCHYFPVGYLPAGMDATVSWGGPEFKFTNNRDYPIRIKAFVSNNSVTVQIYGTNVDNTHIKINFSGAMEVYNDSSLLDADGNPVATGYRATIWCHKLDENGNIVKGADGDYHWFQSEYHYHTEDIEAKVATRVGGESEEG